MECGSIEQPPSRTQVTIWCIVELVVMAILGINCIYGFAENAGLHSIWDIIGLVANGFGIAGLIFVCLGLWQENGGFMKIGTLCFAVTLIISIVLFIISLFDGHTSGSSIIHFILNCFLCYVFWIQSGRVGSSGTPS